MKAPLADLMTPPKLVLLCHPDTLGALSMPRYARMIGQGMENRNFKIEYWTAPTLFTRYAKKAGMIQKWLGYIDSYVVFPVILRHRLRCLPPATLIVVTDHALGMWVPHISSLPHVIHCHDFLAQRSAMGEFPEHRTGVSGRIYQRLIRRGFRQGRNFISISQKTRDDLTRFLIKQPELSEVVYNGLNYPFEVLSKGEAAQRLASVSGVDWTSGYFLHVGGNPWYKNRLGIMMLYRHYVESVEWPIPLVLVGASPNDELKNFAGKISPKGKIHFVVGLTNSQVNAAYSNATALIFPSLEEGFGWPIAEAQASGCPVITTDRAPMTEVGGKAAWYLRRRPCTSETEDHLWAEEGGKILKQMANLTVEQRAELIKRGISNANRFRTDLALDQMERIYRSILSR